MRTTLLIALALTAGAPAVLAQQMPKTVAEAIAMEQADRLPIGDFYSTPANLSATKPGDAAAQGIVHGLHPAEGRHRGAHYLPFARRNRR